ncbi:MAG: hypothetical protein IJ223_04430 [Clostridia bacterium]|nr:hypothetical protein [Clostridia bacterium]
MRKKDYEFKEKYYLKLGIGTEFEEIHEITKEIFNRLNEYLNNSEKAMIRTYKKRFISFINDGIETEIEDNGQDWALFLNECQNKEIKKIENEYYRHRNKKFEKLGNTIDEAIFQDMDIRPVEKIAIEKIYIEDLEKTIKKLLTKKEYRRLTYFMDYMSEAEIARKEGVSRQCINQSLKNISNKLKKNKIFLKKTIYIHRSK